MTLTTPRFGALIIGDEILSGRRTDKHLPKLIEILAARGLALSYVHIVGDDPADISALLARAFASADVVFSLGGIGATPDDHTRQCAAAALGQALALHPQARALILERIRDMSVQQGQPFDEKHPDTLRRLQMGVFPEHASIIPNPYNRIPGFSCQGLGGGTVHFFPGFPVMAWPMIEAVLDEQYRSCFAVGAWIERSVIVYGAMEASLTPLMEQTEAAFPGAKVFSLPSVDHPRHGKHIDLGVKGPVADADAAYVFLLQGLRTAGCQLGPELVRR
ncbi:MAG: molybdopterin-binding protein [Burkholderiaceae bacterium]|nr:molybdopterin-binding protein [Burkholderiaceae bacterium]